MSTPIEETPDRGPQSDRPGPPGRPDLPNRPDRPGRFRGDVPEGFNMGQRMGRITLLACGTCGAAVMPESTDVHTAWHEQMATLLPTPTPE